MNWLLVGVIGLIGGFTLWGYKKGVSHMIFTVGTLIIATLLTGFLGPIFASSFCESEIIVTKVSTTVNETLQVQEKMNAIVDGATGGRIEKKTKLTEKQQGDTIVSMGLPGAISDKLIDGVREQANIKGKITAAKFSKYICDTIAKMIIQECVYIVLFILIKGLLRILIRLFALVDKVSVVEDVDEIIGGAMGLFCGFGAVWIGFLFLLAFSGTQFGVNCYKCINDSNILSWIYNNNLLLQWVLQSVG